MANHVMNYLETHSRLLAGRVEQKDTRCYDAKADVFQCLVVSVNQARREMLTKAAADAGWNTVVCADSHNASAAIRRTKCQMALIDLDHRGTTPDGFRDLCRSLSSASKTMRLLVCGHQCDPAEEIWARQLGVWVYLPGVSLAQADAISQICEQAI